MHEPAQSEPVRPRHGQRPPPSNVDPKTMLFGAIGLIVLVGGLLLAIKLIFR